MVELFRISKGREFQTMGAATEKLRDRKLVRTLCSAHPTFRPAPLRFPLRSHALDDNAADDDDAVSHVTRTGRQKTSTAASSVSADKQSEDVGRSRGEGTEEIRPRIPLEDRPDQPRRP